jgi:hypothetical protein
VVKGKFLYQGEEYSYLMAYLGCTSYDSQDNKIGLAVAKNPQDTFVRIGEVPFVDFEFDGSEDIWEWGVGQPSLVNMDKEGRVMMFYTRGDRNGTRTLYSEWDLSDLSAPVQLNGGTLSAAGLVNLNGGVDIMNNADFLYDPATNLSAGAAYLSYLYQLYGSWRTAFAAYEAGCDAVNAWLKDSRYADGIGSLKKIPNAELERLVGRMDRALSLYTKLYY